MFVDIVNKCYWCCFCAIAEVEELSAETRLVPNTADRACDVASDTFASISLNAASHVNESLRPTSLTLLVEEGYKLINLPRNATGKGIVERLAKRTRQSRILIYLIFLRCRNAVLLAA